MKHDYAINANFNIGKEGTDNVLKLNGIDITQCLKGYTGSDSININADNEISVADGGITTDKLADGAVTADKITEGAVTGDKLAEGAVTTDKILNDSIDVSKLKQSSIEMDPAQISYFEDLNIHLTLQDSKNKMLIARKTVAYRANESLTPPAQILSSSVSQFNLVYNFYSDDTCEISGECELNTGFTAGNAIRIPLFTDFILNNKNYYINKFSANSMAQIVWYNAGVHNNYIISPGVRYPDESAYNRYKILSIRNNTSLNFSSSSVNPLTIGIKLFATFSLLPQRYLIL